MRRLAVAVITTSVMLLAACGHHDTTADELRAAVERTAHVPHRYVYEDDGDGRRTAVEGVVEDDLRYKARVLFDGTSVLDEVVSDDTVADRISEPSALAVFTHAAADAKVQPQVRDALLARRWVVDPTGAPSLTATATAKRKLGADPVLDSLSVWTYVETAMQEANAVRRFNREALDYKAKEDPFPPPKKGSGVVRYDLLPKPIPKANTGGANQALPGVNSFRKLSVYVQHGRVVQILETIDVESRLKDLSRNYGARLEGRTPADQARFAIEVLNSLRTAQGNEPIRVRTMSMKVTDTGTAQSVSVPTGGVEGDLSVLIDRGKQARTAATTGGAGLPQQ